MRRLLTLGFLYWVLFFGLYLGLAAKVSATEIWAGAVAAAVAAGALLTVRARSRHHFQMSGRWIGRLAHVPWAVLADCAVVYRAILRRPALRQGSGRFQLRAFHRGNEHPAARMRRALVTTVISLAPNTFVVGATESGEELLVHQLAPQPRESHNADWPL